MFPDKHSFISVSDLYSPEKFIIDFISLNFIFLLFKLNDLIFSISFLKLLRSLFDLSINKFKDSFDKFILFFLNSFLAIISRSLI